MAVIVGHSQTKGRANSEPNLGLTHRATSRLYKEVHHRGTEATEKTEILSIGDAQRKPHWRTTPDASVAIRG